jgi:hypothetical protein
VTADWQAVCIVASAILPQHACKAAQLVPVEVVVPVDVVVAVLVFVAVVVHTGCVQPVPPTQVPRVVRQVMHVIPAVVVSAAVQLVSQLVCAALPSQGHASMQFM